jgi:uncharacterized protein (DUF433 family)
MHNPQKGKGGGLTMKITPRLIAAIVTGEMYLVDEPIWAPPEVENRARAQVIIQNMVLIHRKVDYKAYLVEKFVEGLRYTEIGERRGHSRDWARSRVARGLRLARGKLKPHMVELRSTIVAPGIHNDDLDTSGDRIEVNPDVMLGKPVIRGTRIPVELILRKLSEGATEADLLEAYPRLTQADIRAALAYAADIIEFLPAGPARIED